MKKTVMILAALLLLSSFVSAAFSGVGSGTQLDPYIITNSSQLDEMRDNLTAYYELSNDIDMTGVSWTAVGDWYVYFEGAFDGKGHTISNLQWSYNDPDYSHPQGLFGAVFEPAWIKNVFLTNFSYTTNDTGDEQCCGGAVVGADDSDSPWEFSNIHVKGIIDARKSEFFGGVIGYTNTQYPGLILDNVSFEGDVYSGAALGGLISGQANIRDSYFVGNLFLNATVSTNDWLGGLWGSQQLGFTFVENSYAIANMSIIDGVASRGVGGLWGEINAYDYPVTVDNVYFYGTLPNVSVAPSRDIIGRNKSNNVYTVNTTGLYYGSDPPNSGVNNEFGATGLTDAELEIESNMPEFDFVNDWAVQEGGTPIFIWNKETTPSTPTGAVVGAGEQATEYAITLFAMLLLIGIVMAVVPLASMSDQMKRIVIGAVLVILIAIILVVVL